MASLGTKRTLLAMPILFPTIQARKGKCSISAFRECNFVGFPTELVVGIISLVVVVLVVAIVISVYKIKKRWVFSFHFLVRKVSV
jgi:hypothetical protein